MLTQAAKIQGELYGPPIALPRPACLPAGSHETQPACSPGALCAADMGVESDTHSYLGLPTPKMDLSPRPQVLSAGAGPRAWDFLAGHADAGMLWLLLGLAEAG